MKKTWIVLTGILLMGCASQKAFVKFQSETKAAKVEQDKTNQNFINTFGQVIQNINALATNLNSHETRLVKVESLTKPKRVYGHEFNIFHNGHIIETWKPFKEGADSGYEIKRGTETRVIYM